MNFCFEYLENCFTTKLQGEFFVLLAVYDFVEIKE